MRKTLTVLLIAGTAMACRGRSSSVQRTQQQYDVVQEGQASGATGTINAPGDVRPPVATQTNVDTTTNFTLPGATASNGAAPGSVATTLPPAGMTAGLPGAAPAMPATPAPVSHSTARIQASTQQTAPSAQPATQPPAMTSASVPRQDTHRTNPPNKTDTTTQTTDTTATSTQAPPPTDTTATTDTTAKTDTTATTKPKEDKPKDEPKSPPTQTDTQAPPPPTQTDTVGGQ